MFHIKFILLFKKISMKKFILLFLLLLIIFQSKAQIVETGAGYFTDLFGFGVKDLGSSSNNRPGMPGFITWGELGFNLKRNYIASIFIGNGTIKHGYTSYPAKIFSGGNLSTTYFLLDINFKKRLNLTKKNNYWHFNPGLGIFFRRMEESSPAAGFNSNGNGTYTITRLFISNWTDNIIGLSINIDFNYGRKLFYFGVRAKSFVAMYYGLEGFLFTPYVGVNIPRKNKKR